jgi:hypothetical protein
MQLASVLDLRSSPEPVSAGCSCRGSPPSGLGVMPTTDCEPGSITGNGIPSPRPGFQRSCGAVPRRAACSPRKVILHAAGAQQSCPTRPHEPPRASRPLLGQCPATRGFVVGAVEGIPRWHASGHKIEVEGTQVLWGRPRVVAPVAEIEIGIWARVRGRLTTEHPSERLG